MHHAPAPPTLAPPHGTDPSRREASIHTHGVLFLSFLLPCAGGTQHPGLVRQLCVTYAWSNQNLPFCLPPPRQEARNILDFYANFENDASVKIPWVRRDLSGPKVLVMEWIDGIR